MNFNPLKTASLAILSVAVVCSAALLIHRNQQLTEASSRIEQLENTQTKLGQQLVYLNKLQQDFLDLRNQVATAEKYNAPTNTPNTQSLPPAAQIQKNNGYNNDMHSKEFIIANNAADTIIQAGYIDPQNWAQADSSIKQLNKEESKVFWGKMFAGIESGAVKLDLEQFENAP